MSVFDPKDKGKSMDMEDYPYVSLDGRPMKTAKEAIEANLGFEAGAGTGVGCAQDPDNIEESEDE